MRYADKIFSNQPGLTDLYRGERRYEEEVLDLVVAFTDLMHVDNDALAHSPRVPIEEMSSPPNQTALYAMLLTLCRAREVLEIGTFVGRTTMQLAHALGEKGRVTTIEQGEEFAGYARENFEAYGFGEERIRPIVGDAVTLMRGELSKEKFDFIFIDGGKTTYLEAAHAALEMINPGGFIVVDDILLNGDVFNEAGRTEKGEGCRRVIDWFKSNRPCKTLLLPMGNGQLFLYGF